MTELPNAVTLSPQYLSEVDAFPPFHRGKDSSPQPHSKDRSRTQHLNMAISLTEGKR